MNLLTDLWVPVLRRDGTQDKVALRQLTAAHPNPVVQVMFPDAMYDGIGTVLLIGIFQNALRLTNPERRKLLDKPPTPEWVQGCLNPLAHHFSLMAPDGEVAFMQDISYPASIHGRKWTELPIQKLVVHHSIGDNTLKKGHDWFHNRNPDMGLCPTCAAVTLYAYQTLPGGGDAGYSGSPVEGALFTLNKGETLWETILLNVLPPDLLETNKSTTPSPFTWSYEQGKKRDYIPTPLQQYWSQIRLIRFTEIADGECSLCGAKGEVIRKMMNAGPSPKMGQEGNNPMDWLHPLCPITPRKKDGKRVKGFTPLKFCGLGYSEYPRVARIAPDKDDEAAAPVFEATVGVDAFDGFPFTQWVFRGQFHQSQFMEWQEMILPVYSVSEEFREEFQIQVEAAVDFYKKLEYASFSRIKNLGFASNTGPTRVMFGAEFSRHLEAEFFRVISALRDIPDADGIYKLHEKWAAVCRSAAYRLFDERSTLADPMKRAKALRSLQKMINKAVQAYAPRQETENE